MIGDAEKCLVYKRIVSIEEYNATNKLYCDKCELHGWDHNISEIGWYN